MLQTRSPIVNSGPVSRPASSAFPAAIQTGMEEVCPEHGPWYVRQTFERGGFEWMAGLLGGFFPSLPRVLDFQNERAHVHVRLGTAPGESMQDYCQRMGPLPVGMACTLVWRLASELEALESWMPEAVRYLDPLRCKVGLWQQEFLHLFVDRFEKAPVIKKPSDLPARLLKLCSFLLDGRVASAMDPATMARLPTSLLTTLRDLQHTGSTSLDIRQVKGVMLVATAAITRGLRGSNVMPQLAVNERWYPQCPQKHGRMVESIPPGNTVRLSRLLAHRNRLGPGEVTTLLQRVLDQAETMPEFNLSLDPQHILLKLPSLRDGVGMNDSKVLDIRLDSLLDLSVVLEAAPRFQSSARSPVRVREAHAPDHALTDLGTDIHAQLSRLSQTLQDGTFSLSGYDMGHSAGHELPGLFSCYLGTPAHDKKALDSLKSAIGEALAQAVSSSIAASESSRLSAVGLNAVAASASSFSRIPAVPQAAFPSPESMKMILITAGSGGTGKSTVARLIYELANFEQRDDVAMFDCDAMGNRDFQKISPDKIESMPIDNVDTMRRLVETAMDRKLVLADLPASCQDILARDLNPEIIQSLRMDEGLHWMPIHLLTAKAAAVPAIKQWRTSVFGDSPSVLIVSMKDGPVSSDMLDEVARPQDIILRMPMLDQSLASALDASSSSWQDILDGKAGESHRMFGNPLVKRQLRFKRKECEDALFPLLRLIVSNQQAEAA